MGHTLSWKNETELFLLLRKYAFSAVLGDILDQIGYHKQFLAPSIKPLRADMVVVGRAMPVLEADVFGDITNSTPLLGKPFGVMFEALDDLKPNEVYIASGASLDYALWGGLMSTRALFLKSAGAVLNGFHRDSHEIESLDFPVFSQGGYAQDQRPRGKVLDWRVPLNIHGVRVQPGDLIFADRDGVLVVPQAVEAQVIEQALCKAETENKVRTAIQQGMSTVEAFATFGVM